MKNYDKLNEILRSWEENETEMLKERIKELESQIQMLLDLCKAHSEFIERNKWYPKFYTVKDIIEDMVENEN